MNLMLRPIRKLKTLDSKQKSQNKSLISNKPNKPVIPKIKKKIHSKKFYENTKNIQFVIRQVNFNWPKIVEKCQDRNIEMCDNFI